MKLNNTIAGVISAAALVAVSASAAMAVTPTPVPLGSSTGGQSPNVTYTAGGTFTGADTSASYKDRYSAFGPVTTSFVLNSGAPSTYDSTKDVQSFSGPGSFSYGSLLSGTFTSSTLTFLGTNPSGLGSFAFVAGNVTFTGGSRQDGFTTGSLTLEAQDASPGPFINSSNTGFNSFTATDGVTIDAIPNSTPEPATVVPFAIGGLALLGLVARKARRNSSVTA